MNINKTFNCLCLLCSLVFFWSCSKTGSQDVAAPAISGVGTGGSMAKYTIMNDYLYTVEGILLSVYDVKNASRPVLVKNVNLNREGVETIFATEDHLFFGTISGLLIYSIKVPSSPVYLSAYGHVTSCDPVVVKDDYAYVTLSTESRCPKGSNAMEVINISNILNPVMVKTYPFTNPRGMAIYEHYMFLCDGISGLKVLDISGAPDVKLVYTMDQLRDTYDAIVKDNILTVTGTKSITQYNCSNPENLVLLSSIPTGK
jgi:hypothetical protein